MAAQNLSNVDVEQKEVVLEPNSNQSLNQVLTEKFSKLTRKNVGKNLFELYLHLIQNNMNMNEEKINDPSVLNVISLVDFNCCIDPLENYFNKTYSHDRWTFFSVNTLIKKQEAYANMLDVAVTHGGLGSIHVLSYILESGTFSIRFDGGMNDYDRVYHYKKYSSSDYDPKTFPLYVANLNNGSFSELTRNVQYSLSDVVSAL